MKPIVIEVRDGKINMSVSEFKKYIEDAYQQGYSDASKLGTYNPYWWRDLTCTNGTDTLTGNSLKITYDASDKLTGALTGKGDCSVSYGFKSYDVE